MATLPPEEQLEEIKKWFAAVAARYPDIEWLQVVNEATWIRLTAAVPKNAAQTSSAARGQLRLALGGENGTDGTGYDWIPQRIPAREATLPEHEADAQRRAITEPRATTST